jgi:hypothetical protein
MLTITTNFDQVTKRLNDLSKRAQELDGEHVVPLAELMPPEFMSECSSFQSLDELFKASPFTIDSPEDFKAIPDADWDQFIAQHTSYETWQEMQQAAAKQWTLKKLKL